MFTLNMLYFLPCSCMEKQQFKIIIWTESMLKRKFHSPSADWLKSALLRNGRRARITARVWTRVRALLDLGRRTARGPGLENLGIRAYSLVPFLEKREKNSFAPVTWDSLTWPHFAYNLMQPRTTGVKEHLVKSILSRGTIVSQLPNSHALFIQGWWVKFTWVMLSCGGIRWWEGGVRGSCMIYEFSEVLLATT